MKKYLLLILAIFIAFPTIALATSAVPWSIVNLTDKFISPNLVNGSAKGINVAASSTIGAGIQSGGLTISGGSTTTGKAIFSAGSVSSPALQVSGGEGLYQGGTGILSFSNGVSGLSFDGTNFYPNSSNTRNLGINSTNIWNNLYVNNASTSVISSTGNVNFNTAGYPQDFFGPYDSSPVSNVEINDVNQGPFASYGLKVNNGGGTFTAALVLDTQDTIGGIPQYLALDNQTGSATCLQIKDGGVTCLSDYNGLSSLLDTISPAYSSSGTESGMTTTLHQSAGQVAVDYGIQNYPGSFATGLDAYQNYYSNLYAQPLPQPDFSYWEQANGDSSESATAWHWLTATTTPYGIFGTTTNLFVGDIGSSTADMNRIISSIGIGGPTFNIISSSTKSLAFSIQKDTAGVLSTDFQVNNSGGFSAFGSSTIGNGTQAGGLTINGNATTTGNISVGVSPSLWSINSSSTLSGALLINNPASPGSFFTITSSGQIGFATTTPLATLTIGGTGGETIGTDYDRAAPTNGLIVEGNVGIGTTSPGTLLSLGNLAGINFTTGTSTFNSTGGINLNNGCFAVDGACLSNTTGTVNSISTDASLTGGPINISGTLGLNLSHTNVFTVGQELIGSTTIGDGTQGGGLTVSGGATSTGNVNINQSTTVLPPVNYSLNVVSVTSAVPNGSLENTSNSGYEGFNLYNNSGTLAAQFLYGNSNVGTTLFQNSLAFGSRITNSPLYLFSNNDISVPDLTLNKGLVGIGTTTPTARFVSVAASTTAGTIPSIYNGVVSIIGGFENTVFKPFEEIDQWGGEETSGDTPSVSGGTSSVSGNQRNGNITVAGVALTSVTLTFSHPWPVAPDCVVSDNTTASVADITSISTTQVVFGLSVGINSGTLWYICQAHQ